MKDKAIRLHAGAASMELVLSTRDGKMLLGGEPFVTGGVRFLEQLGVFRHFGIAKRASPSSWTADRSKLRHAAEMLRHELDRDADLLQFDYSFAFPPSDKSRNKGGASGFLVRGYHASIHATPPGYCTLVLSEMAPGGLGRAVEFIDMRNRSAMSTDQGAQLTVYRRKVEFRLPAAMAQIVEFLGENKTPVLTVTCD